MSPSEVPHLASQSGIRTGGLRGQDSKMDSKMDWEDANMVARIGVEQKSYCVSSTAPWVTWQRCFMRLARSIDLVPRLDVPLLRVTPRTEGVNGILRGMG